MRKRAIIIGIGFIFFCTAFAGGIWYSTLGENYAHAMMEHLGNAKVEQAMAHDASCKRVIDLYSRCLGTDRGTVCKDLHIAEDEHRFYFENEDPIDYCHDRTEVYEEESSSSSEKPVEIPMKIDPKTDPLFRGDEETK